MPIFVPTISGSIIISLTVVLISLSFPFDCLIFFSNFFWVSVNPLFRLRLCLDGNNLLNSSTVSLLNSSMLIPLYENFFAMNITLWVCLLQQNEYKLFQGRTLKTDIHLQ